MLGSLGAGGRAAQSLGANLIHVRKATLTVPTSTRPASLLRLTADGYYTSRVGLIEELRYAGNTAPARFPAYSVPEP